MSLRDLFEHALTELNKVEAPPILTEDFNYLINKAVQQYINLTYSKFEYNQQAIDDLRVLKTTAIIVPELLKTDINIVDGTMLDSSYFVKLPEDYLHLLKCIVEFKTTDKSKPYCPANYNAGGLYFVARKLTSDLETQIINNAYLKPSYKRPYYCISNFNDNDGNYKAFPGLSATNSEIDSFILDYQETNNEAPSNLIEMYNSAGDRLANASKVRLEIKYGNNKNYEPIRVYVDYLKAPMYLKLTEEQRYSNIDTSQILEFPDYVCYEILNIFVRLLLENFTDPRLQTNIPLNNTIPNPLIKE